MVLVAQEPIAAPVLLARARRDVGARLRELLRRHTSGVADLAAYHLGLVDQSGQRTGDISGKCLRPALLLAAAEGYDAVESALDAAVAVELTHAFSLVHDDIEDGDRERRHRPTLWALHGVPLALNGGDYLFALAHRVLADAPLDAGRCVRALSILDDACLAMIAGQHRDLAFESTDDVDLDAYRAMAAAKTGALIGAALALGALCGGACDADIERLREAGAELGLAFQAVDDVLAIWGDAAATGKPARSDLARGKKSLPVVLTAAGGVAPSHRDVRAKALAYAGDRAANARRAIERTALRRPAIAQLDALIEFVLTRDH